MKNRSPVSLVAKVKKEMAAGGQLEVECTESVYKIGSLTKGGWVFNLVTDDGENGVFRSQVVTSQTLEQKVVSTANGLVAFALSLGVTVPLFPLEAGVKVVWRVENIHTAGNE